MNQCSRKNTKAKTSKPAAITRAKSAIYGDSIPLRRKISETEQSDLSQPIKIASSNHLINDVKARKETNKRELNSESVAR